MSPEIYGEAVIAKMVERFRPQAIYGNPSRRQVFTPN
jgi:hypothetical protein